MSSKLKFDVLSGFFSNLFPDFFAKSKIMSEIS